MMLGGYEVVSALLSRGLRIRMRGQESVHSGHSKVPQLKVLHEHLMQFWSGQCNWCKTIIIIETGKKHIQSQSYHKLSMLSGSRLQLESAHMLLKVSLIPIYSKTQQKHCLGYQE